MNRLARTRRRGLTSTQTVLIILAVVGACFLLVVGLLAAMLLPALARAREEARRVQCRSNLNQVAKGMFTYLNEFGDNRFYPCPLGRGAHPGDYNGAEWLASLYWSGTDASGAWAGAVVPDPGIFLCPSTDDSNAEGRDLGTWSAPPSFGPQSVSYAGMHYRSQTDRSGETMAGAIRDDFPPNMPMASDDTQGSVNHGRPNNGGMSVLFFDSHVEFRTHTEVDLQTGVGAQGADGPWKPLLWQLRN